MSIETLSAVAAPPSAGPDRNSAPRFVRLRSAPRFVRLRDAPRYLGMDKNRFNRDVRPGLPATGRRLEEGAQGDGAGGV
jgi:hypothetical protein